VVVTALRLLYNLSFDKSARESIMSSGMLTRLIVLLKKRQQLPLVLRILYNLTTEEKARTAIAKTEAPSALRKQVIGCAEHQLPPELAALAINLATNTRAAELMSDGGAMRQLLEKLYQTHDTLLLKFLRNLTQHEAPALHACHFAADLFALVQQVEGEEMLLELLGLLANLRLRKLPDLPQQVSRYGLIEFLQRHLVPGFTEDDVLLEIIIIAGELAANADCAVLLYRSALVFVDEEEDARGVRSLYSLITEKQEDDEIVLQLLFAFYRLLQVDEPRDALLQQTQIVIYLLDLLLDQNNAIRQLASSCLDAVAEADEQWAAQIRQRKFQMHNHQWLELVDEDEAEEYHDALALNNALQLNAPLDASQLGDEYLADHGALSPSDDPEGYSQNAYVDQYQQPYAGEYARDEYAHDEYAREVEGYAAEHLDAYSEEYERSAYGRAAEAHYGMEGGYGYGGTSGYVNSGYASSGYANSGYANLDYDDNDFGDGD